MTKSLVCGAADICTHDIQLLRNGIKELGFAVDEQKINQLLEYTRLLQKWNKIYSLTAINQTNQIITHHLLDGLTLVPYIADNKRIIDIGSGMGVPGVVLAIWRPLISITLLDSNQKKCAFLRQAAIELGLRNVDVVNSRVESYEPKAKFDIIISRAFASTSLFIQLSRHLLVTDGYFLAMKSRTDEIVVNCKQIKVKIPGVGDQRVLLKCRI